jgi:hypothetical protein
MPRKDKELRKEYNRQYYRDYYKKNRKKLVKKSVEWRKKNRLKLKKEIIEILGGKCVRCGYSKSIYALDLHHTTDDKKDNLGSMLTNTSRKKCLEEAKKCILLCANCHREEHYG